MTGFGRLFVRGLRLTERGGVSLPTSLREMRLPLYWVFYPLAIDMVMRGFGGRKDERIFAPLFLQTEVVAI